MALVAGRKAAVACSCGLAEKGPELVFYASFDRGLEADVARGRREPIEAEGVEFRPSARGRAVYVKPGGALKYAEEGNLPKDKGAVEVWIKPLFPPTDRKWRPFLWEEATWREWEGRRNVIALWFWGDAGTIRFDVRDPKDCYITARARWHEGDWLHIVACWDCERGLWLYVNGRLARFREGRWRPVKHGAFCLGCSPFGPRVKAVSGGRVALDELRIYDAPLPSEEVARRYREFAPVEVKARPPVIPAGREGIVGLEIVNLSSKPFDATASLGLEGRGKEIELGRRRIHIRPGGRAEVELTIPALEAGLYSLVADFGAVCVLRRAPLYVAPPLPLPSKGLKLRKIAEVDLTKPLGPGVFCDDGTSRVVESPAGRYREAGEARFSRFAVRFEIEHPGRPHIFLVRFPDDKPRCAEVTTYSPHRLDLFNAHTGYLTGDEFPLSGRMLELPLLVWPREREQALVFMTWGEGEPAAAQKVEVYEVEGGLPEAVPESAQERLVGLFFEDPMLSYCFGALNASPDMEDFDRAARNLAQYMRFCGFNCLFYPLVWYTGPLYDSDVEPPGKASNRHPSDGFVDILLHRLHEIGAKFFGNIWLHSIPSLREKAVDNDEAVRAGADTPLTVRRDSTVTKHTFHHRPPLFNPVHPETRRHILALVREILQRFGGHPAFGGICLHLATPSPLWWGTLDVDYGDLTISLFERETGIKVPVPKNDPFRFTKRYNWLMENAREAWIEWRCKKVTENIAEIAKMVRGRRPDLKLVVAVYPPVGYAGFTPDDALAWREMGKSAERYLREVCGLDISSVKAMEGVAVMKTLWPADYRWCKAHGRRPPELLLSREVCLDPSVLRPFRREGACGVNLHNRYFETDIGRRRPLKCLWWGPIVWRASAVLPVGRNFLEMWAHAVAEIDATILLTGGYTVGTVGREEAVREFASVFRRLPPKGWKALPLEGPAKARVWRGGRKALLCAINEGAEPVRLSLDFKGPVRLTPLAGGSTLEGRKVDIRLKPFQLVGYEIAPPTASPQRVRAFR